MLPTTVPALLTSILVNTPSFLTTFASTSKVNGIDSFGFAGTIFLTNAEIVGSTKATVFTVIVAFFVFVVPSSI